MGKTSLFSPTEIVFWYVTWTRTEREFGASESSVSMNGDIQVQ